MSRYQDFIHIFKNSGLSVDWSTIKVGWDLKILTSNEIGLFATDYLENNPTQVNKYMSELVFGIKEYEMDECLKNVFQSLHLEVPEKNCSSWNKEWRKWRYCIMENAIQNSTSDEELLQKIEEIYADFGYPEDMISFIYYMPADETIISRNLTPDEARAKLVQQVKDFLFQEKIKIEQGIDVLPARIIEED